MANGNGGLNIWIKIALWIAPILVAFGITYARVMENTENIKTTTIKVGKTSENVSDIKADIREIRIEQKYIKEGIDDIKKKL